MVYYYSCKKKQQQKTGIQCYSNVHVTPKMDIHYGCTLHCTMSSYCKATHLYTFIFNNRSQECDAIVILLSYCFKRVMKSFALYQIYPVSCSFIVEAN